MSVPVKHCSVCGCTIVSRSTSGQCRTHFMGRHNSPQLDRFAELLAEGTPAHDAVLAMGLQPNSGRGMLAKLRRRMGWQAQ